MSDTELARASTVFDGPQKARLDALIPEFESFVTLKNPTNKDRCNDITKWKIAKAQLLMQEEPFRGATITPLVPSESGTAETSAEYKDWYNAIRRYFTNHYNNKFRRKVERGGSRAHVSVKSNPSPRTEELGNIPTVDNTVCIDSRKSVQNFLQRAFIIFSSELSARELFAKENEKLIKAKMRDLSEDYPDLLGGGLRQKAVKFLWEAEDKDEWEAKIDEMKSDIHRNQEEFEPLIFIALEQLCERKRLGSVMMSFSYAFRDVDDGLKNNTIYMGYNDETDEIISAAPMASDQETLSNIWRVHADSLIPRKKQYVPSYNIQLNENGVPIIPSVDFAKASLDQITTLLYDYLLAVWAASPLSKTKASIPWDEISVSPGKFIDHTVYHLPIPLSNPKDLTQKPLAVYGLYEYFHHISTLSPFQFNAEPMTHNDNAAQGTELEQDANVDVPTQVVPNDPPSSPRPVMDRDAEKTATRRPTPQDASPTPPQPITAPLPDPPAAKKCVQGRPKKKAAKTSTHKSLQPVAEPNANDERPIVTLPTPAAPQDVSHSLPQPVTVPLSKPPVGEKRGRGRPKADSAQTATRKSSRTNIENTAPTAGGLKRKASSVNAQAKTKVARTLWPGYDMLNDDGKLVNVAGELIDSEGNVIETSA